MTRLAAAVVVALLGAVLGAAGPQSAPPAARPATASARSLAAKARSSAGADLEGIWTSGTLTPFERPAALGAKATYSEAEMAAVIAQGRARRESPAASRSGDVGSDNEAFVDRGYEYLPTRQTSLIVLPADGRLPFRPEAEKRRDANLAGRDDPETMSPWDRCITRGPMLMLPTGYNNGIRIVQTPGFVTIETEMIHEARIVPTDGSPHLPAAVRRWTGDPRGHWEGRTLVIDSTNFIDGAWVSTHAGSGRLRGTPTSGALHIVERLTRLDAGTIEYTVTVEDPQTFTQPWAASMLFRREDDYQLFEYACHEGNYAIELVLRGARAEERRPAGPPR